MSSAYGRSGAQYAQKSSAPSRYDFAAKSAGSYLSGAQRREYKYALNQLTKKARLGKGGRIKKHQAVFAQNKYAVQEANRLRNLAAGRAFQDYTASAMQHSKPWLATASGGLLTAETVQHSLANAEQLGGAGVSLDMTRDARRDALSGTKTFGSIGVQEGQSSYMHGPQKKKGSKKLQAIYGMKMFPGGG